ncbi:sensory box sensor histidine kinase/response regulator [Treponema primitia ZAS-2]|uniref:histidine kinase n=1 Tax=Treponema primitia (strain ATCC BAA-887 / DSM 12427 / ZAS-2) TaxID=545694 RepID=F5YRH4_TREPZ|nr:ATP-binding protein [Treponema primitia]AEF86411.1 sensory box sensor histidine kinase/response regulator [Treponema primitia ZAS-2]
MIKGIVNIIWNILTSGKAPKGDKKELSDYIISYILMNFIAIFGFIFLTYYIIINTNKGSYTDAALCLGMSMIAIVSFIAARTRVVPIVPAMIILNAYCLFCVLLIWNGDAEGMNFLFVYLVPPLTLMMERLKQGIIYSTIVLVVICIEVFVPGISKYYYSADIASRIIVTYLLIFGTTIAVEATRAAKDRANSELTAKLREESQRAEAATTAKSNFLANTSHEIRTPMNAIIGISELVLREEISPRVTEYITDIKQAGHNLLVIINDILDFSKIESGRLDIVKVDYLLGSVINDVISIIRTRLSEKPIIFTVDIDSKLPNHLIGDEVRLRQILMNLLSNAVKYTRDGHMVLSISGTLREDRVVLTMSVSDTGIGIKQEDMGKLFGQFQQLDTHKNQGIEGTGLGLAISRNLCRLMGGDITVSSVYGEGSIFTATILQHVQDSEALAVIENPETKAVLLYESRKEYTYSIIRSMENLGVPVMAAGDKEAFSRELWACSRPGEKSYAFVFVNAGMVEEAQALIRDLSLPTKVVLLVNQEEIASFRSIPTITMPAYTLSIANVISDKIELNYQKKTDVRFTAPGARLLIVDDIVTNLNVAKGLLSLYQTDITTVTSGKEAIELIKKNRYDIVFMDHMMPEMDGIETTAAIRAWEDKQQMLVEFEPKDQTPREQAKHIPIIALTANAVTGMKEMFLAKGFNDYLSKPIEISKLDGMMAEWIPAEKKVLSGPGTPKRPTETTNIKINGVDTAKGIAMTGGTEGAYRKVLASFHKDALERLPLFERVPNEQELSLFTTSVHALKSASATIGALGVSQEAAKLEAAGKAGDLTYIGEGLSSFYWDLKDLSEQIGQVLNKKEAAMADSVGLGSEESKRYLPLFEKLSEALKQEEIGTIHRLLAELEEKPFDPGTIEIIGRISNAVLMTEFEDAIKAVKGMLP